MKEGIHCSPLRDCQVKMFWIEAWIFYQPANSVHLLNIERFLDCMYIDKENLFYSCNTIKIFIQIFWIEGMILLSMFKWEWKNGLTETRLKLQGRNFLKLMYGFLVHERRHIFTFRLKIWFQYEAFRDSTEMHWLYLQSYI